MKAVCLTSGGLDSSTCMAIAKDEGRQIYALSFLYGQRHNYEISAAKRICKHFGAIRHLVLKPELEKITTSTSLIDKTKAIPTYPVKCREGDFTGSSMPDIPSTYVPARNLIFLSFAVAWAETIGAGEVYIGVNAVDYSGYPDCRPGFLESFQDTACLATKVGIIEGMPVRICAPLLYMTKAHIIRTGLKLGVDFAMTSSCYQPDTNGMPCGKCHSCQLRLKGFRDAGLNDPLRYQS